MLTLLRALTVPEQHELARLAGTKRNYLYQLSISGGRSPSVRLAKALADASRTMHRLTQRRSPILDIEDLC